MVLQTRTERRWYLYVRMVWSVRTDGERGTGTGVWRLSSEVSRILQRKGVFFSGKESSSAERSLLSNLRSKWTEEGTFLENKLTHKRCSLMVLIRPTSCWVVHLGWSVVRDDVVRLWRRSGREQNGFRYPRNRSAWWTRKSDGLQISSTVILERICPREMDLGSRLRRNIFCPKV